MKKYILENIAYKLNYLRNSVAFKSKKMFNLVDAELIILDDIFPHPLSPFRIVEYNDLLRHFNDSMVISSAISFRVLGENREFYQVLDDYLRLYPINTGKIKLFNKKNKLSAKLCYVTFLQNAIVFYDYIVKCRLPFVLELYPGGGFQLKNNESDRKLRKIISSRFFKKIIVTQKISYDYLVENGFCRPDQIEFIYGGVFPQEQLVKNEMPRRFFPNNKKTLDICFVAHKYMPQGRDKGYDVFIETARLLSAYHPEFVFHVVGPFGPDDMPVADLGDRIIFYGTRTTDFFPSFYANMDIILSPNVPFMLMPGAFDGFPTGACMEAGMCGTAVFCCDELKLNPFIDREDLVILTRNASEIAGVITEYFLNPEKLYQVSRRGQQRFRDAFSYEQQMVPRIKLLENILRDGDSK